MGDRLYIFVDESGNYASGRHYVVASCWCLSDTRPRHVLENARGQLAREIGDQCGFDTAPSELKGSSLPSDRIGGFLRSLQTHLYSDGTVSDPPYAWEAEGQPLRCSRHRVDPEVGTEILSDFVVEPDAPKILQQLALARVLAPLTHEELVEKGRIDEIRLVPDAEVWKTPAHRIQRLFSDLNDLQIEVETRDSAQTPGIRVADLMAYSSRSYAKDGRCAGANDYLSEIEFEGS